MFFSSSATILSVKWFGAERREEEEPLGWQTLTVCNEECVMDSYMTDTPEIAFEEIRRAIAERDFETFCGRVELENFLNASYDEATEELAKNCEKFHGLYPHDVFFHYGEQNIRDYNEEYRRVHLGFLERFISAYFGGELRRPKSFEADPVNCAAYAFHKIYRMMRTTVGDVTVEDEWAVMTVEISGNIIYRKIIGALTFKFAFARNQDGMWRLRKVTNIRELTGPILDVAETFWPKSWDLGISF